MSFISLTSLMVKSEYRIISHLVPVLARPFQDISLQSSAYLIQLGCPHMHRIRSFPSELTTLAFCQIQSFFLQCAQTMGFESTLTDPNIGTWIKRAVISRRWSG